MVTGCRRLGLLALLLLLLLGVGRDGVRPAAAWPETKDASPLGGPPWFWRPGHAELYRWSHVEGEQVLETMDPATGRRATLVHLGRLRHSVERRPLSLRGIGRTAPPPFVWEPSGQGLVVVSNGDLVWKDLGEAPGAARRLTETSSPLADVRVAPGGRYVSFSRDHDLWVVATKTGEPRRLTSGGSERLRNATLDWVTPEEFDLSTACWWAPDGSRIAYLQLDEHEVRRYLVPGTARVMRYPRAGEANPRVRVGVVPVEGGATTWLDLGGDDAVYVPRVAWAPDGTHVLATVLDRRQQTLRLLACPIDGGQPVVLLEEHDGRWIACPPAPRFVDERRFLWRSAAGGHEGWFLATLPKEGMGKATLERLTNAAEDVVGGSVPSFDAKTGRLHHRVETDDGLRQRPRLGTEGVEPAYAPPPGKDVSVRFDATGTYAIVSSSSTFEPKRVELRRVEDGTLLRLLQAPPAPKRASLPRIETGRLDDGKGRRVWRLWSPIALDVSKAHPLMHLVYGGPGFRRIRDRWDPGRVREVRPYLDRGWLVLEADGLGSTGFGAAAVKKVHGRLGLGEIDDQVRAVRAMAARPTVDASRIGITGWSFGGTMTCLGLMRHPDVYRVGVAIAPVTDWRLYDTIYTERYLGLPGDDEAAYRDTAVVGLVGNLRAPLLVIHGEADDNVHVENTRRLEAAARAGGKASLEVLVFPGVGHGLGRRGQEARARALAFLERYLVEGPPPQGPAVASPEKPQPVGAGR